MIEIWSRLLEITKSVDFSFQIILERIGMSYDEFRDELNERMTEKSWDDRRKEGK